jgi:hypothetical protein
MLVLDNHDVFRLKISVNNSAVVQVLCSDDKLIHYVCSFELLKIDSADNVIEEVSVAKKLRNDVDVIFRLIGLVVSDDVRVMQNLQDISFVAWTLDQIVIYIT